MLLYSTIAEKVKKLEKVSMEDKMPSNYYSVYEEQDDFRPQKRLKLDIKAASSKDKDFSLDHKEHVRSDATLVKTKLHKEFTPNVSKTGVSLINAELWKKLMEVSLSGVEPEAYFNTIAEQVKKQEKENKEDKMPSNYNSAYEEPDDFRS